VPLGARRILKVKSLLRGEQLVESWIGCGMTLTDLEGNKIHGGPERGRGST
jgi:hypothetical protein